MSSHANDLPVKVAVAIHMPMEWYAAVLRWHAPIEPIVNPRVAEFGILNALLMFKTITRMAVVHSA